MLTKREIRESWGFSTPVILESHFIHDSIRSNEFKPVVTYKALKGEVSLGSLNINQIEHVQDFSKEKYVLVPTLAWNDSGYRIGRGGGFYDKLFSKHSHLIPIFVTLSKYKTDFKPEQHDIKAKIIIYENGIKFYNDVNQS